MTLRRRWVGSACAGLLALHAGCGDSSGPRIGPAAVLAIVAGSGQTGQVGTALPIAPSVKVSDAQGNGVPNVAVTFAVSAGGGSIAGASATTDNTGTATAGTWTLGNTAGSNTLTASVSGVGPATFTATGTAGPPASLTKVAGDNQPGIVGQAVATPPAVRVRDSFGNPVVGVPVVFAVTAGGGAVAGGNVSTNAQGQASPTSWTLGQNAGQNTLTATAGSLPPETFSVMAGAGAAAIVAKVAGDLQTGTVGAAVATAPAVRVTDQFNNPVANVAVTFAVASGGGSVVAGTTQTNAAGMATVGQWTLGTTPGTNTLTATAAGIPPATFSATANAGAPALVTKEQGDNQTASAGAVLPVAPAVKVTDPFGNALAGVSVVFNIGSGGGQVIGGSVATGANGIATVGQWRLGNAPGPNTLTVTVGALPVVVFNATATQAGPAAINKIAGDNQTVQAGTVVPVAPRVRVIDANGNPVPAVTVTFAPALGSGSVVGASVATNANGEAAVGQWTLGPLTGAQTLNASVAGVQQPAVFTATATQAAPALITKTAGDNQMMHRSKPVATAPTVRVAGAQDQPLAGVVVTFAVASGGGTAIGTTVATNAEGLASVGQWTMGLALGQNTLTATVQGLPPVTFTATSADPCPFANWLPLTIGTPLTDAFAVTDCIAAPINTPRDGYAFQLANMTPITVQYTGQPQAVVAVRSLEAAITMRGAMTSLPNNVLSFFRILLPAGSHGLTAQTTGPTGPYTLNIVAGAEAVNNCDIVWIAPGVTTQQVINATDCIAGTAPNRFFSDRFLLSVVAGRTYTITMRSTVFDAFLRLLSEDLATVLTSDDDSGGGLDAQIIFTATSTANVFIDARTFAFQATGAYTLTVTSN